MNERVKKLAEEFRKLPPEEQADLIDELIVLTYREPDPETDKAWVAEMLKRWERYKAGDDKAVEASEAIEAVRARLAKRRDA